jgi:hypothetical protein
MHKRYSIRSHGGAVNSAVPSFPTIYTGIANRHDPRFGGPRFFQPVQIREDSGSQLHELFSLFEVVKAFSALFESMAALAFSRCPALALGSWSGNRGRRAEAQKDKRQSQSFHLKLLLPTKRRVRQPLSYRIPAGSSTPIGYTPA